MMKTVKFCTWLVCLLSGVAQGVVLSWEDSVRFATAENPALETARKVWIASQEAERAAYAGYLPSLNAQTSATRTGSQGQGSNSAVGGIVSNGFVVSSGARVNTNYLASLNISQNLFGGLEDTSKIDQAKWRAKNSYWGFVAAKSQVSYNLKDAFANLTYVQDLITLSQSILERRESNYKLVSVRYQNGRENKGSVLLAEAYLEQAQLDLLKAKDSRKVAEENLRSIMNVSHLDTIEVQGDIPLANLDLEGKPINDFVSLNPSYNQALAVEMASAEDVSIARSSFLPSLDLNGNVTKQDTSYFPQNERWSVALTLTIPIFDGLRDYSTMKSAIATRYANQGRKKTSGLELVPKLNDALNLARQSDIKYRIDSKFQEAASTRAEIARARYNNGLITFEDWDIIERELIERQTAFLQSKKDRVVRYSTWENLLGRGAIK